MVVWKQLGLGLVFAMLWACQGTERRPLDAYGLTPPESRQRQIFATRDHEVDILSSQRGESSAAATTSYTAKSPSERMVPPKPKTHQSLPSRRPPRDETPVQIERRYIFNSHSALSNTTGSVASANSMLPSGHSEGAPSTDEASSADTKGPSDPVHVQVDAAVVAPPPPEYTANLAEASSVAPPLSLPPEPEWKSYCQDVLALPSAPKPQDSDGDHIPDVCEKKLGSAQHCPNGFLVLAEETTATEDLSKVQRAADLTDFYASSRTPEFVPLAQGEGVGLAEWLLSLDPSLTFSAADPWLDVLGYIRGGARSPLFHRHAHKLTGYPLDATEAIARDRSALIFLAEGVVTRPGTYEVIFGVPDEQDPAIILPRPSSLNQASLFIRGQRIQTWPTVPNSPGGVSPGVAQFKVTPQTPTLFQMQVLMTERADAYGNLAESVYIREVNGPLSVLGWHSPSWLTHISAGSQSQAGAILHPKLRSSPTLTNALKDHLKGCEPQTPAKTEPKAKAAPAAPKGLEALATTVGSGPHRLTLYPSRIDTLEIPGLGQCFPEDLDIYFLKVENNFGEQYGQRRQVQVGRRHNVLSLDRTFPQAGGKVFITYVGAQTGLIYHTQAVDLTRPRSDESAKIHTWTLPKLHEFVKSDRVFLRNYKGGGREVTRLPAATVRAGIEGRLRGKQCLP